jgi:hypothetical protein
VPVVEALFTGFHRERTEVAVGKRPKWRLPDADYGYRSHVTSLLRSAVLQLAHSLLKRIQPAVPIGPQTIGAFRPLDHSGHCPAAALQQPSLAILAGFHAIQPCLDVLKLLLDVLKLLVHLAFERVKQRLEKLHRVTVHTAIL